MDGLSWAILACIGSFVYRQYARDPRGFVGAWENFVANVSRLFAPAGSRDIIDDGQPMGNLDSPGIGSLVRKRKRSDSIVLEDPELLSASASPRRRKKGQQDGSDDASTRAQAEDDFEEASLNVGESDNPDEGKGRKKNKGNRESKKRRQMSIAKSVKDASGDHEGSAKPDDALSDGKAEGTSKKSKDRDKNSDKERKEELAKGDEPDSENGEPKSENGGKDDGGVEVKTKPKQKREAQVAKGNSTERDQPGTTRKGINGKKKTGNEDADEGVGTDEEESGDEPAPPSPPTTKSRGKVPLRSSQTAAQISSRRTKSPKTPSVDSQGAAKEEQNAQDSGLDQGDDEESEEEGNLQPKRGTRVGKTSKLARAKPVATRSKDGRAGVRPDLGDPDVTTDEPGAKRYNEPSRANRKRQQSADDDWSAGDSEASTVRDSIAVRRDPGFSPKRSRRPRQARAPISDTDESKMNWSLSSEPATEDSTEHDVQRSSSPVNRRRRRDRSESEFRKGNRKDSREKRLDRRETKDNLHDSTAPESGGDEKKQQDTSSTRGSRRSEKRPEVIDGSRRVPVVIQAEESRHESAGIYAADPDNTVNVPRQSEAPARGTADENQRSLDPAGSTRDQPPEGSQRTDRRRRQDHRQGKNNVTDGSNGSSKDDVERRRRSPGDKKRSPFTEDRGKDTQEGPEPDRLSRDPELASSADKEREGKVKDPPPPYLPFRADRGTASIDASFAPENQSILSTRRRTPEQSNEDPYGRNTLNSEGQRHHAEYSRPLVAGVAELEAREAQAQSTDRADPVDALMPVPATELRSEIQGKVPTAGVKPKESSSNQSHSRPDEATVPAIQVPAKLRQAAAASSLTSQQRNPSAPGEDPHTRDSAPIGSSPPPPRRKTSSPQDNGGPPPDSVKNGLKTYYAENSGAPPSPDRKATATEAAAAERVLGKSKPKPIAELPVSPPRPSRDHRKQAKPDSTHTANDDTEYGAPAPEPAKGFWRGVKDGFRSAREHKTKTFVCFLLSIGYVVATGYGNEYGTSTPAIASSAQRLSARQFASTALDATSDSVSGAIDSAKQRLNVAVSQGTFQEHFLAISILWHLVIQFCIVFLLSEIITPPGAATPDAPTPNDQTTPKSGWRTIGDKWSAMYHAIRDPLSHAYHTARHASKWTFIRLGLIAFLGLTMLLVARQLSSLAHIAADPRAAPWSDWPDVTLLHGSLRVHVSQLGNGRRILAASFWFWGMTGTALVFCISALADRPAEAPVDEEMGVEEEEEEGGKRSSEAT